MLARLFVVGAGGFGREVHEYAREAGAAWGGERFEIAGFLDDNPDALAGHVDVGAAVVGGITDARPTERDRFVLAIGAPRVRRLLAEELAGRGARFVSIVSPRAWVARETVLGAGVVVGPLAYVGPGARLDDHVLVNPQVAVAHDVHAARWAVFSPMSAANGGVTLGDGAFLGTHATVLPGRHVGAWAYVGAGALVNRDVPPATTVIGIPARVISTKPAS